MNTHVKNISSLLFVCQGEDKLAVDCLAHLQQEGYTTKVLSNENAPIGSIALYTGYNESWPSKCFRVAAQRLYQGRPKWSVTTPFLVSIKPQTRGNMHKATEYLADMYLSWYNGQAGTTLPWETRNGRTSSYKDLVESWLDLVAEALGENALREILESQINIEQYRGRGGYVVYKTLGNSGRIVTSKEDLPELEPNTVYEKLVGTNAAVVSYGTSDVANVFELLETLKLAHTLGLPAVFETYPGSHNVGWWLGNFLNPSLKILGAQIWSNDFGLNGTDKYTAVVPKEVIPALVKSAKLENIQEELLRWSNQPFWKLYQDAMRKVAEDFLNVLGINVEFHLTTTEDICQANGVWDMPAKDFIKKVEDATKHAVVVLHRPDDTPLMSSQPIQTPNATIGQLHEEGWWLGGASLYHMVFSLGNYGGVIAMVKDSTAGEVNIIAKNFFTPKSQLYLSPVGLFRLSAEEQKEDWSVDPLVLLSLMKEWGSKTSDYVRTIWNAMEVPLDKGHIGRKTMAKISRKGVSIGISDS